MNLFDDSNARNLESSLETMTPEHDTHTGASAVIDAPEHAQPSPAEPQASAPEVHEHDTHATDARENETPESVAPENSAPETAAAGSDDFAAALQNFETEAEESVGDDHVIKGSVVKLTATHVVVDIGAKYEGMASIAEILDHEGKPKFQPGDEIDVMRDKGETEEGYVNLSHLKAQRLRSWDEIERAYNEKQPIKGIVVERIKGGLTLDIQGARAFLPGSQVDLRPIRNLDGMKGQTMEVAIIKLNKKRGNIVVSRKQLLEEEQNEKRGKTLEHLEEGSVLTGIVKNLTEYGAFVDMGGIDGLLHITDMSWGRLTHPRDLVHVSEMTWSKRMKHPSKLVNVGDEVDCVVLSVNPTERRISLGMRQLASNPWDTLHDKYPVGATVEGRVRNLTEFGAFIEIEDGIDGLVHVSNLSWTTRVKHPSEVLKKGDKVKAVILAIEPDKRRLSLGVKQMQPDVWDSFFVQHRIGEIDFKIIKMNQEEKKVGLSIKAVGEEASRQEVESYKHPASSSSTSTTIGDLISWKRAGGDSN